MSSNIFVCPSCGYFGQSTDLEFTGKASSTYQKMQVPSSGYRQSRCPNCGGYERVRLIYLYLKDIFGLESKAKSISILHIAPEPTIVKYIAENGFNNYYLGDKFTKGYSYPEYVKDTDITKLQFPDNTFDLVICNHVLEHIPNDRLAMSELYRVLKPNSRAILQVPYSPILETSLEDEAIASPEEREINFGQFDHVRLYGNDYPKRLKEIGFTVEVSELAKQYPEHALDQNELLFVASK
jgi:SAM-dependent methyltransferase